MKNDSWYKELRQETSEHKGFWTRGTKLNVGALLIVSILLGAGLFSAMGTRTITDTSDTVYTKIVCSNGNVYDATVAGLKAGMWSMNTTGGVVTIPRGTFAFTNDLLVTHNVTLVGEFTEDNRFDYTKGTVFTLTGASSVIVIDGRLQNIQVNTITGWTATRAVIVNGSTYMWERQKVLDNINVRNAIGAYGASTAGDFSGTGVAFMSVGTVAASCISKCDFGSISSGYFNLGVLLYVNYSVKGAYINGNTFERININRCTYGMNLTGADAPSYSAIDGNSFVVYDQQPRGAPGSKGGIYLYKDCAGNNFMSVMIWDWFNPYIVSGAKAITLIVCNKNVFNSPTLSSNDISDSGYGNIFNMGSSGSSIYTVYPMGTADGTNIDTLLYKLYTYHSLSNITMVFMPGVYDINAEIQYDNVFCDFQFMKGAIWEANALFPSGDYALELTANSTISGPGIIDMNNVSGAGGIKLSNSCSVDGMTLRNMNGYGIYVTVNTNYSTIQNCVFKDSYSEAIYVNGGNCSILNNIIDGVSSSTHYGIRCGASARDILIENDKIKNCKKYCIYADDTGIRDIHVKDCVFSNSQYGIYMASANNVSFTQNTISHMTTGGIRSGCRNTTVLQNTFFDCATPVTLVGPAITSSFIKNNIGYTNVWDTLAGSSPLWNSTRVLLGYCSPLWNSTRAVVSAKSATWNATSTLVTAKSAAWNLSGNGFNVTYITNSNGHYWAATGANLQLAIYDLNSTFGGTVWAPSGKIYKTSTLYLTNHTTLTGSGVGSTELKAGNGFADSVFIAVWRSGNKRFNNVTISDMTINGNGSGVNGIYATANTDCRYFNLHITNCSGNGLWVGTEGLPWCNRIFVDKVISTNILGSISLEGFAFNNVTNSSFSNLQARRGNGAFQVDFHGVRNSTIDNIITEDGGGIKIFGEGIYYCQDITVDGLVCKNMTSTATGTNEALWIYKTRRAAISNVVTMKGYNGIKIDTSYDINLDNIYNERAINIGLYLLNSYRINIDSAIIRATTLAGFYVSGCNNVTASKLQVFNPGNYNYLYNSKFIKISLSTFANSASYGLDIDACSRVKISECSFFNNVEDGITTEIGGCHNYTITNNDFSGNDKACDIKSTDQYFAIYGNICLLAGDKIDLNAASSATRRCNESGGNIAMIITA